MLRRRSQPKVLVSTCTQGRYGQTAESASCVEPSSVTVKPSELILPGESQVYELERWLCRDILRLEIDDGDILYVYIHSE